MTADPMGQFRDALRTRGIIAPEKIIAGTMQRADVDGKHGKGDASYIYFADGIPAGGFENHKDGREWETWRADIGRTLSPAEQEAQRTRIEAAQRERAAQQAKERTEARERAAERWAKARPADPAHRYLVAKEVKPHGIRQEGDLLLIPMRDGAELHSLQTIAPDGDKLFMKGGRMTGCYYSIGTPNGAVCIAEGYATGATIHEATGHAVAVAFNAGNLEPVARAIRAKLSDARIIICADDDYATAGNPGLTRATEAARAVGGLLAVPNFGAGRPEKATDFNDLAQHAGADFVQRAIANARPPEVSEPQGDAANAAAADSDGPTINLVCAADVTPEAVRWYWREWIAAGKLHILAGPPGSGKTTLALALAATITIGGRWPDGGRAVPGDVVIWSGEDGIADTLVPRLIANGADVSRVHFIRSIADAGERRPFDPASDTATLALTLSRRPNPPSLLIVDPIVSAVAGDSHKNTETRRALQPVVDLGERIGCAIIGISHFSKDTSGRDPVERVTGSVAFGAFPRVVMAAVKTRTPEGDAGPRLFARAKSNLGPDGGGFHYSIEQVAVTGTADALASRVLWGDPVEGQACELLAAAEVEPDADTRNMTDEATDWLREYLAHGAMPADEATREGRKLGHTDKALRKARERLGVKPRKTGLRGGWRWELSAHATAARTDDAQCAQTAEGVEDAQPLEQGALDAFGDKGASSGPPETAGEVF